MRARIALPVFLLAVTPLAAPAKAHAGAWSLAPGEYTSELRGGWQSSDTFHDENGNRRLLYGGGLWEERSLVSANEFGWTPRLNFLLALSLNSVTRRFGAARDEQAHPTQTGLGDARFGVRFRILNGRTAAALQLDWKAPLGYERERFLSRQDSIAAGNGDSFDDNAARQLGTPVLGDGQQDLTLSLGVGTAVPRGFAQASGGYRYRFEDLADQIVLEGDLGFWLMRSLLLGGRYVGEIAAEGERPTLDPDRHRVGPALIYRVDDGIDLFASSLHTFKATNALHTDEIFVGLAFKQTKLNRFQGFLGSTASP